MQRNFQPQPEIDNELRRIVPLEPNALEWLKTCDQSADLCPSLATVKRDRKALRLRNSAGIRMRHYYNIVSAEATAEFWGVKPKPAEAPIKAG